MPVLISGFGMQISKLEIIEQIASYAPLPASACLTTKLTGVRHFSRPFERRVRRYFVNVVTGYYQEAWCDDELTMRENRKCFGQSVIKGVSELSMSLNKQFRRKDHNLRKTKLS